MNMRAPQIFRKRITPEDSFVVCISDLMAGLLSIFILTLIYYIFTYSQVTDELTNNDEQRKKILEQIQINLKTRGVEVKIDVNHGVLRMPEGILFDIGQADIKENGLQVIKIMGPVLLDVLENNPKNEDGKKRRAVETIFVEGHTDSIPMKSVEFASNWELSAKRAINTWTELEKSEPRLSQLKNEKEQLLFSCSGYAATRPVKVERDGIPEPENRRIDFRFSMTPPQKSKADKGKP